MITKDLGMVTAYAYAVSKGYTGTETEFAELMASYASVAQEAVDAALAAAQSAQAAESAKDTAQTTVDGAIAGIQAEGQTQVGVVQAEGQTQVGNVNTAGSTQVSAVQAKGTEVLNSIPADYTALSDDVTDLKSAIDELDNTVYGNRTELTIADIGVGYYANNVYNSSSVFWNGTVDVGVNSTAIVDIREISDTVNIEILNASKEFVRNYRSWTPPGVYTIPLGVNEKYLRVSARNADSGLVYVYLLTTQPLQTQITDLQNIANETTVEVANKVSYEIGRNKFNKNSTNIKNGVAIGTNGKLISGDSYSGYIGYFFPINGGVTIVCNYAHAYLGFCTDSNDLTSMSVGDSLSGWISNSRVVPSAVGQNISVPQSAKYMFVSIQNNRINDFQIEIGTVVTPYRPYEEGINENEIMWDQTTRIVGVGHYYSSIQSAIDASIDGDIIEVMPGVYNEAVTIPGATGDVHTSTKDLHIIGFNRDECILTHDIGDYYTPPLEIASGFVENLTIIGTGTTHADGSNQFAYCVHIDYNSAENKTLQFRNCRFVNTVYPCVGAATRNGFKLSFVDCIFECDTSAAFLMHEQQASNKTNQGIQFENCTFISNASGDGTIHVQESDGYTGNSVALTFARCIVKNTSTGPLAKLYIIGQTEGERTGWLNSKIYNLTTGSALNSDVLFNA